MNTVAPAVLLVEDEPLIAFTLEEELTDAGFKVTAVEQSDRALVALEERSESYRAIVTDIDLGSPPDGWALGHRARELDPSITVIYISGRAAYQWSANGVPDSVMLQKPFSVAKLITALSTKLNESAGG